MGTQGLDLYGLLVPFGPPFSSKYATHRNLLNRNTYNAKTSFLPYSGLPFRHQKSMKKHVFSRHPPKPHFSSFYLIPYQKMRFVDPLQIQSAPNGDQNRTRGVQMPKKLCPPDLRRELGTDWRCRVHPMRPRPLFESFLMDFGTLKASLFMICG